VISAGKRSVLGVHVDVVDYEAAVQRVIAAAHAQQPLAVSALAVHGVMTGVQDAAHCARLNQLDLVTPDGQPVRWALNWLYRAGLADRVYGPEMTWRILSRAADEGLPVFLYGSSAEVLARLTTRLRASLPNLTLAGSEPSRYRSIEPLEAHALADRLAASGARIVLVGLGCPRQEMWAWYMRRHLSMPLVAVGAAFDYHAGTLRRPPAWMQRRGLEWAWRLALEPRRLWRRYLVLNPVFTARLIAQKFRVWTPGATDLIDPELSRIPG